MIDRRNDYVDYKLPDWKATTEFGPTISHLAVVQCGFERLSAKDEKWFRTRLMEFHWSSFSFSLYMHLRWSGKIQSLEIWRISLYRGRQLSSPTFWSPSFRFPMAAFLIHLMAEGGLDLRWSIDYTPRHPEDQVERLVFFFDNEW